MRLRPISGGSAMPNHDWPPPPVSAPAPRRWRKRFLFWLMAVAVVVLPFVIHVYYGRWLAEQDLRAAIAEVDAVDPEWRLEQIEAKRAQVADDKNSARIIVA